MIRWEEAKLVNFHERDSLTVFYGEHTCGVCKMRDLEPIKPQQPAVISSSTPSLDDVDSSEAEEESTESALEGMDDDVPEEEEVEKEEEGILPEKDQFPDWEVSELPSQMVPWTSSSSGDHNPTLVVTYDNTPTVVTYDNTPLFSYKPTSPEGTTVRSMKEISNIKDTIPLTTVLTTTTSTTTTISTTTATTTTTTTTTTAQRTTTKSSTVMMKTTPKPEPVPTKQKCEAQKVYLDGTGWLELTRKVGTECFFFTVHSFSLLGASSQAKYEDSDNDRICNKTKELLASVAGFLTFE